MVSPIEMWRKICRASVNGVNLLKLSVYKGQSLWWTVDALGYGIYVLSYYNVNRKYYILLKLYNSLTPIMDLLSLIWFLFTKAVSIMLDATERERWRKQYKNKKNKLIIILTRDLSWRKNFDLLREREVKGDVEFDPIIKAIFGRCRRSITVVSLSLMERNFFNSLRVKVERMRKWMIPIHLFERYFTFSAWLQAVAYRMRIWRQAKILFNETIIGKVLEKNAMLRNIIEFCIKFQLLSVIYFETTVNAIRRLRPACILMINEYGQWERSVLMASKMNGVKVVALQHGVIHEGHKGYMYDPEDINNVSEPILACPMPDRLLVYGPGYKELLTKKGNIPGKIICVVGNPKYDSLALIKKLDKERIKKKYGVPKERKVILWATQQHGIPEEENKKNIEVIVKVISKLNNVHLLVKQHPGEKKEHDQLIRKVLEKLGSKASIAPKDASILELLYISDVLITKTSTVAVEAALLGKPVVVLNLSGKPDEVDYVKKGIALGAYSEEELKQALRKLLADPEVLSRSRASYVSEKFFKVDGRSSMRIVDEIVKLLEEK